MELAVIGTEFNIQRFKMHQWQLGPPDHLVSKVQTRANHILIQT